jgi:hypothetical protein
MPRETKAQRLEREAAFRAKYEEENRNTYFPRLMQALEAASNLYWDISVKNGMFVVKYDGNTYVIPVAYSAADLWKLEDFEYAISVEEYRQTEARRKQEFRISALNKLTVDERKALNLE